MYTITLHDTESEEIIGLVTPEKPMDFPKFEDLVRKSWTAFHSSPEFNDGDYSIEDYVEYHNANYKVQIDWVVNDFIQLSNHRGW